MLSAGRTSVCKVTSRVHVSTYNPGKESFTTYANTNKDHLDIAEHLRDTDDNVEYDGHQLRETRCS